jgi:hypothetical protein
MRSWKGILLVTMLIAALSGVAAFAQDRDDDDYYRHGRDNDNYRWGQNQNADAREHGYHQGYRDGWYNGRNARNSRWNYSQGVRPDDDRNYQNWMGPKGQYKKGYRSGYQAGYGDAYYGRRAQNTWTYGQNGRRTPWDPDGDGDVHYPPQYPNNQYPNGGGGYYGNNGNAQRFGYADGQQAGQRDRSSRHSYRPTEWEAYRDADHGMSSSTGYRSENDYKTQYRQAFMNGYNQGYGYRR